MRKIKDKLAKLLVMTEDNGATQGEIENALNAAQQIMARHNLTRDDIDMSSDQPAKNVEMTRYRVFALNRNATAWEGTLAHFVTEFIGNIGYYKSSNSYKLGEQEKRTAFYFYGSSDEAEAATELYQELQTVISMMSVTRYSSFYSRDGGAYAEGFVDGLLESNIQATKNLVADSQTASLIAVSQETSLAIISEAKNWLATEHKIKLRTGQGLRGSSGSGNARQSGKRDGKSYGVSKPSTQRKLG